MKDFKMMVYLILFVGILAFTLSSSHYLLMLLTVEFMVLGCFILLTSLGFSWVFSLVFLLVGVCMGAYGVSLMISLGRAKGSSYVMSFFV